MAFDATGQYVADPVAYLKNIYSTDPLGYNAAISHQGDMDELAYSWNHPYETSNFLGGPGGLIGHQMQTVFDAANLQGQAQTGKNAQYNKKQLPGQPALQGLQNADPSSPEDPINQWRKQQKQDSVPSQPFPWTQQGPQAQAFPWKAQQFPWGGQ